MRTKQPNNLMPALRTTGAVPTRGGLLQRAAVNSAAPVPVVPPIVHDVLRSPGRPLDAATRALMEPRFGHDFSGVRVHTDNRAAESARAVDAWAYTVGRDVVFGAGQYAPGTSQGRHLLAHELTHVAQQEQGGRSGALLWGDPGGAAEREAEQAARSLAANTPRLTAQSRVARQVQRAPRSDDPIHAPLIDQLRRERGLPPGGVDESGQQVGPSDAEIKYGQRFKALTVTVPPPPARTLTADEAQAAVCQNTGTAITPASSAVFQPLAREPVRFGLDFTSDTSLGQQVTLLPRHLDAIRFRFLGMPVDAGHEPGLNLSASLVPGKEAVSAGIAGSILNLHFQDHGEDFIELALGQGGCSYDSNDTFSCTAGGQAEIHSRNNHFSITISGGGAVTRMPDGTWTTSFTPLTFGLLVHILNP